MLGKPSQAPCGAKQGSLRTRLGSQKTLPPLPERGRLREGGEAHAVVSRRNADAARRPGVLLQVAWAPDARERAPSSGPRKLRARYPISSTEAASTSPATDERVRPLSSFARHAPGLSRPTAGPQGAQGGLALPRHPTAARLPPGSATEPVSAYVTAQVISLRSRSSGVFGYARILSTRSWPRERPEQPLRYWVRA